MNRLWEAALDLLFPPKCPFCRALLQKGEEGLCASCREHLPWLEGGGAETAVVTHTRRERPSPRAAARESSQSSSSSPTSLPVRRR